MFCSRCKESVPEGAAFCPWCGKCLDEAPPPQRKRRRRPKGSGSVYKATGTRARPYVALTPKREVLGTYATSGEAVQALDAYLAQRVPARRLRYTFEDVYTKWSAEHFKEVGAKGRDSYERAYRKAARLYQTEMRDLKQEDYQAVINELVADGKSRSMCEKQRQLFSQMCQWAMKQDIITQNYASCLKLPAAPKKKERILSAAEIAQIQQIAANTSKNNRFRRIAQLCMVLVYTGMRIDELLSIRRADVFLDKNYMIGGEKTEAGRGRIIPILTPIKDIIAGWMLDSLGSDLLLPSTTGKKRDVNTVEHSFQNFMEHCGINTKQTPPEQKVTPHSLRRTAATRLVQGKAEQTAVQAILGHKDFSTTADFYTVHSDPEYLLQEMRKLEG